jgi:hypothetical protein
MPGVLVLPPAVAHPDEQIPQHDADPVVPPSGYEDLPVRRVMPEERDLREHDREHHGGEQLPPAVTDPDEHDEADRDGERRR